MNEKSIVNRSAVIGALNIYVTRRLQLWKTWKSREFLNSGKLREHSGNLKFTQGK